MTEIKRLRLQKNLRVPLAAREAGVYPCEWYLAERGETKIHPKLRRGISAVLGVGEDALFAEGWPVQATGSELATA